MAEELGRIQRPPASQYDGRRKLLLVPLVYGPQSDNPEGAAVLQNYWESRCRPRWRPWKTLWGACSTSIMRV